MNKLNLAVLPLLATGLLAQGTPEIESNDTAATATPLAPGDQGDGTIGASGDVDFYAITLTGNSDLLAWTNAGTGTSMSDTDLALFDTDGTTLLAFNDDVSGGTNWLSRVADGNLPAGTYYLRVRSSAAFDPLGTGRYTLDVIAAPVGTYFGPTGTPTFVGERPENNDPRVAGGAATWSYEDSINFGVISTSTNGTGFNQVGDDYDFYRIQVTGPGTLIAATRGGVIVPMRDTVLFLADSNLNLLAVNDDGGPDLYSLLNFVVTPGLYYVAVKGWGDTGSYELAIGLAAPTPTGSASVTVNAGGCGPTLGVRTVPAGPPAITEVPVLGSTFYLDGQTNLASALLLRMISLTPLGSPFVLPGTGGLCQIEVDVNQIGYYFASADTNGDDYWALSTPVATVFIGLPIEQQIAVLDLAANLLGMTVSNSVSSVFGIEN